jgi:hypothetical protein
MVETDTTGWQIAVGQLTAGANERHHRELYLMAIRMARNSGVLKTESNTFTLKISQRTLIRSKAAQPYEDRISADA